MLVVQVTMLRLNLGRRVINMNHLMFMTVCLLLGCAQGPNDILEESPMFTDVDPGLQQYFDEFQTPSGGVSIKGITAGFTELENGVAGLCVWGGVYNEVRIDKNDWDNTGWSEAQKQQLVSHELGHCALFLQHINNCNTNGVITNPPDAQKVSCNGIPGSIMNWQMFNWSQAQNLSDNPGTYYEYLKLNQPIP